jgi:hypothetical protein
MNTFRALKIAAALPLSVTAIPAGVGLFFLVRLMEGVLRGSMLINVLLEEGIKVVLFIVLVAVRKILSRNDARKDLNEGTLLLFPLLCIVSFGITENIIYFLTFPTSSIYQRLLFAYAVHLNTALLYALAFLSGTVLWFFPFFLAAVLYHLGLNMLSLSLTTGAVYGVSAVNLVILFLLYWLVQIKLVERSILSCWNPK